MQMRLHNTLSRQVEVIQPLQAPNVTVYTCGPTVYDYAHVGHWFTYVRWDTLIRSLKLDGYTPRWVMNITDVGHLVSDADDGEDKLEKGARREGKTAWEVADFYTNDFLDGLKKLSITTPDFLTKATDHISEQIELIQTLESKGYTYTIDDGVYFDTSKFPGYANFAKLDLDDLQAGARVELNPQKRNPSDFALWKFSPDDHQRDMEWDSPFGGNRKGFPGWHIECSAMAMKYLGATIDIHAGGIDHIPVHHTNEIAQSEAATGQRFCNYWLHSNHVLIEGEKISKSLGNGIKLQTIIDKGIDPAALRLHILESHYRSQSRFSWQSLEAAKNRLAGYQAMADQQWQTNEHGTVSGEDIEQSQQLLLAALQEDLNTPQVLAEVSRLESLIASRGIADQAQGAFKTYLQWLDDALGLGLLDTSYPLTTQQADLLAARQATRAEKDWSKTDALRDQLWALDIAVLDTARGQVWQHRA